MMNILEQLNLSYFTLTILAIVLNPFYIEHLKSRFLLYSSVILMMINVGLLPWHFRSIEDEFNDYSIFFSVLVTTTLYVVSLRLELRKYSHKP